MNALVMIAARSIEEHDHIVAGRGVVSYASYLFDRHIDAGEEIALLHIVWIVVIDFVHGNHFVDFPP